MGVTDQWIPEDTFASRLALVRQHKSWNVAEAARECEVDPQAWRNWEAQLNKPRAMDDVVEKIAVASGCDPRWLMFGNEAIAS